MLIDIAPEPGPSARGSRLSSTGGTESSAEPAGSFGAVLARLESPRGSASAPAEQEVPPLDAEGEAPPSDAPDTTQAPLDASTSEADAHLGAEWPTARSADGATAHATAARAPDEALRAGLGPVTGSPQAASEAAAPPAGVPERNAASTPSEAEVRGHATTSAAHAGAVPATYIDRQASHAPAQHRGKDVPELQVANASPLPSPVAGRVPESSERPTAPELVPPAPRPEPPESVALPKPSPHSALAAHSERGRNATIHLSGEARLGIAEGAAPASGAGFGDPAVAAPSPDGLSERLLRPAGAPTAEMARDIAQQIATRIVPLARGQFELTLAPAELGRLHISLREVDGLMTLSVTAERPETLEMIRRHVDLLAQELRQIAQRELALQLGTGGNGGGARGRAMDPGNAAAQSGEPATVDAAAAALAGLASDHLDLRL
jgi:flagellar hook-length control protein FliK